MASFIVSTRSYYDPFDKGYHSLIVLSERPPGPLAPFARKLRFPNLDDEWGSAFSDRANRPCPCAWVLLPPPEITVGRCGFGGYRVPYLAADDIPALATFSIQRGYHIETQLTTMLRGTPLSTDQTLVFAMTYFEGAPPSVVYTR